MKIDDSMWVNYDIDELMESMRREHTIYSYLINSIKSGYDLTGVTPYHLWKSIVSAIIELQTGQECTNGSLLYDYTLYNRLDKEGLDAYLQGLLSPDYRANQFIKGTMDYPASMLEFIFSKGETLKVYSEFSDSLKSFIDEVSDKSIKYLSIHNHPETT